MVSMLVIDPTISKYIWPHRFIGVGERPVSAAAEGRRLDAVVRRDSS